MTLVYLNLALCFDACITFPTSSTGLTQSEQEVLDRRKSAQRWNFQTRKKSILVFQDLVSVYVWSRNVLDIFSWGAYSAGGLILLHWILHHLNADHDELQLRVQEGDVYYLRRLFRGKTSKLTT